MFGHFRKKLLLTDSFCLLTLCKGTFPLICIKQREVYIAILPNMSVHVYRMATDKLVWVFVSFQTKHWDRSITYGLPVIRNSHL